MKRVFVTVILVLWIAGCDSSTTGPTVVKPDEQFRLKYGETVVIQTAGFSISFKDLGEDSRCPEGALCVWAGNARVIVRLSSDETSLNTTLEPRETTYGGYKVRLLEVKPHPVLGVQNDPTEYVITLVVTKE